ncbi:MAG: MBL fold metallo-hydrolase [Pseudomonadota bacterium]
MFVESLALMLLGGSIAAADKPPAVENLRVEAPPPEKLEPYVSPSEWAKVCKPWDDWEKSGPPFKITSDVYYVGTCGITALLVETDSGLVLIDVGTELGGADVWFNVFRVGHDVKQIKFILYSHEHFDHIGGVASMQLKSGAPVLSSPEAVSVFRTGKDNPNDPQAGLHKPMGKVANVIPVSPGTPVHFGGIAFTPIATPGHTPGALTWQWKSCDGTDCKTIVYADSMSPVSRDDYKFSDHPEYVAEYREGIARIAALECDILLTPHPSASFMVQRAQTGSLEGGMTCEDYAAAVTRRLDARLEREAGVNQ